MRRFGLIMILSAGWLFLPPDVPARADYIGDQIEGCAAFLTPESRAAIIAACDRLLQMGELPVTIQSPAFVARGNAYSFIADYPKALADFAIAIAIDPRNPAPLAARGLALMKQKKFAEALSDFNSALELDGQDAIALYGRGLASVKLGKEGTADMAKAKSLDPSTPDYFAGHGLVP
ncbi:MAG TPA: tetratricopeptide repeat protein [Rhizomicrobium sp.]|nr:tetratricopeptide repeat protein [Rhizomicrobium sp.]